MPIKVQRDLPAKEILENENIFVMDEYRAMHQDIRPLNICILNLMPVKQDGTAACPCAFEYASSDRRSLHENEQPSFPEYADPASKQIL